MLDLTDKKTEFNIIKNICFVLQATGWKDCDRPLGLFAEMSSRYCCKSEIYFFLKTNKKSDDESYKREERQQVR